MTRASVVFVALVALALLSNWVADILTPQQAISRPERHTPDFFLTSVQIRAMDENGALQHRMSAARIVHYSDDDSSELLEPRFYAIGDQGPLWEVRSDQGHSDADGKVVMLRGAVTMTQLGAANGVLHTRDLLLRPRENYVETAAQVTFQDGTSHIEATGLRGNLGEGGSLQLLAKVRGVHAPSNH